jgi:hypothetical protein
LDGEKGFIPGVRRIVTKMKASGKVFVAEKNGCDWRLPGRGEGWLKA